MPSLSLFPASVQGIEEYRDTRTGHTVRRVVDFASEEARRAWILAAPLFHARSAVPEAAMLPSRGPTPASLL